MLKENLLLNSMNFDVASTDFGYWYFFFNVALSNFACGDYIIFMLQSIKFDVAITLLECVVAAESFQPKCCIKHSYML